MDPSLADVAPNIAGQRVHGLAVELQGSLPVPQAFLKLAQSQVGLHLSGSQVERLLVGVLGLLAVAARVVPIAQGYVGWCVGWCCVEGSQELGVGLLVLCLCCVQSGEVEVAIGVNWGDGYGL